MFPRPETIRHSRFQVERYSDIDSGCPQAGPLCPTFRTPARENGFSGFHEIVRLDKNLYMSYRTCKEKRIFYTGEI